MSKSKLGHYVRITLVGYYERFGILGEVSTAGVWYTPDETEPYITPDGLPRPKFIPMTRIEEIVDVDAGRAVPKTSRLPRPRVKAVGP